MKKFFSYFVYLAGVLSLIYMICFYIKKQPDRDTESVSINEKYYWFELGTNGKKIENLAIRNISDDTLSLKDVIGGGKFIIYNPKISCQPCLDSMVSISNEIFTGLEERIMILSRFYTLRDIKFFSLKNGETNIPIYDILPLKTDDDLDKMNKSMAFLCDSTLTIRYLFVYKPRNTKMLQKYLLKIKSEIENLKLNDR